MEYIKSEWNGFERIDFTFKDRQTLVIFPKDDVKTDKWMLKTEYFDAFPALEIQMLERGYHLVFLKNRSRWGTDDDQEIKRDLADFLVKEFGFRRKCVCVGMSCGGLHAVCFASRYPTYVSLLYLDAPLLSFTGWSRGNENNETWFKEIKTAYGFTTDAEVRVYNDQPIHRLKTLTDNNIPVALVYGAVDTVVDPKGNAEAIAEYYNMKGAPIKVWCKSDCDHHPHGFEENGEIIEYIEQVAL